MSIVERAMQRARAETRELPLESQTRRPGNLAVENSLLLGEIATSRPMVKLEPARLAEAGLQAEATRRRQQLQEFRGIKRALLSTLESRAVAGTQNIVATTSAVSGEGKTYVSFNLALSLASELDLRILLVDADLLKRDLSRKLGLADAPGLSDLLTDRNRSLSDVLVPTDLPQLHILPAGRAVHNSAELLCSSRMKDLVDSLVDAEGRQVVVLDAPPVLLTPDAVAVTSLAGSILFVVRAMFSLRAEAQEAVRRIGGSERILAILNSAETGGPFQRKYAYGYYGDYGQE